MSALISVAIGLGVYLSLFTAMNWADAVALTGGGYEHPIPQWYSIMMPVASTVATLAPGYVTARLSAARPFLSAGVVGVVGSVVTGLIFGLRPMSVIEVPGVFAAVIPVLVPSAISMALYSFAGAAIAMLRSNNSLQARRP